MRGSSGAARRAVTRHEGSKLHESAKAHEVADANESATRGGMVSGERLKFNEAGAMYSKHLPVNIPQ